MYFEKEQLQYSNLLKNIMKKYGFIKWKTILLNICMCGFDLICHNILHIGWVLDVLQYIYTFKFTHSLVKLSTTRCIIIKPSKAYFSSSLIQRWPISGHGVDNVPCFYNIARPICVYVCICVRIFFHTCGLGWTW